MPTIDMEYGNANFTELFSEYLKTYNLPSTLEIMPKDDSGITFKQRFIDRNYYKEIGSETEELFTMHLAIKCQECVNRYLWKLEEYISERDNFMNRVEKLNEQITDAYSGTDTDKESGTKTYIDSGMDNTYETGTRTVSSTGTDTGAEEGTRTTINSNADVNTHEQYYNPLNSSADNIVNKDINTTDYGKQITETPNITNKVTYGRTDTETPDITNSKQYGKTTTETPNITNSKTYGKQIVSSGYREHLMYFSKSYPELMELVLKINNIYEEALEFLDVLFMGVL